MKHNLTLEGMAFRLRPIEDVDASLVLNLRSNPNLNRFLHVTSTRLEDQLIWLADYYRRPGDYYFVVERRETGETEGVVSIYNIDATNKSGEWGRWILRPGSLAAVESALLIYRCAFELLDLERVYCRTVADNSSVVSFHDSCGITDRFLLQGYFELGGQRVDAFEHGVKRKDWPEVALGLENLARIIAQRLNRG